MQISEGINVSATVLPDTQYQKDQLESDLRETIHQKDVKPDPLDIADHTVGTTL